MPDRLTKLDLTRCFNLISLPNQLPDGLQMLHLGDCKNLNATPELIDNLASLEERGCKVHRPNHWRIHDNFAKVEEDSKDDFTMDPRYQRHQTITVGEEERKSIEQPAGYLPIQQNDNSDPQRENTVVDPAEISIETAPPATSISPSGIIRLACQRLSNLFGRSNRDGSEGR